jgi:hypothetical protein
MMNPRSMTFKAFTNPRALTKLSNINKPGLLEIELPSVNGTGTARALATVCGELATGGAKLGLEPETVAELERPQPPARDLIFDRWALSWEVWPSGAVRRWISRLRATGLDREGARLATGNR